MNARRIGIDITSALTQGGGIGRYTRELIHALVSINSADELHLFSARIPVSTPLPESLSSAYDPVRGSRLGQTLRHQGMRSGALTKKQEGKPACD